MRTGHDEALALVADGSQLAQERLSLRDDLDYAERTAIWLGGAL